MHAFNAAASYAAEVGFRDHVFSQQAIHVRCYRELRDRFGLSAQMAVRAIGKAVEASSATKQVSDLSVQGAMTYDDRFLGWKGPAHVSLLTLTGREVVAMVYGEYQAVRTGSRGKWIWCTAMASSTSMRPSTSLKTRPFSQRAFLASIWGLPTLRLILMGTVYTGDTIELYASE